MLPNPDIAQVKFGDYVAIVKKRIFVILAFLIVIPSVVTINVNKIKPVYRATVSILIERQMPRVTKFDEAQQQAASRDSQYYQTQYSILASRLLATKVVENLKLSSDPDFQNTDDPAGRVLSQVKVEPARGSQIVLVHVEDTDALRASAIANGIAKAYIQQDLDAAGKTSRDAVAWLETQLVGVQKNMRNAQEALNTYIQENRIVTIPDIEKKTESLLEGLKRDRMKMETDLSDQMKRYKNRHPKIISLNAQLDDIKKKIEEETNNLLELNQKMVQYRILEQEADSNKQLYVSMLTRAKEKDLTDKLQVATIRIIDAARPPSGPIRPLKSKEISRSFFIALLCGLGLAFFLEYLDSSIHTAEDVRVYLNLPFLGYIANADKEAKLDTDKNLVCYHKQKSPIAEAYRSIRTSILFSSPDDKPLKSILVTSTLPQEGKTFVSTNLATIFSQLNERIVILDIDMRRPKMHKAFKVEQKSGLSDYLTGTATLKDIIKPTLIPNLYLIPSGTMPPNPSELLSSTKIRGLFDELKLQFDRIMVDSPPLLSVTDASLLVNIVDGTILVVRGVRTRIDAIIQAKTKLAEAKGRIIGVVINDIAPEKEDKYYYYHYYYSDEKQKAA